MKTMPRMIPVPLLGLIGLIGALVSVPLALPVDAQTTQAITAERVDERNAWIDRLVAAHGFDRWGEVGAIEFAFNVQAGPRRVKRSWRWEPVNDWVVCSWEGPEGLETVSYRRNDPDQPMDERAKQVDRWFINDTFWLLLPLHLKWARTDESIRFEPMRGVAAPGSPAEIPLEQRVFILSYPAQDDDPSSYTPGDRYALIVDEASLLIQGWTFYRDSAEKPTLGTHWNDHRRVGPLILSLDRPKPEGGFRLWFTDVRLKLRGEEAWRQPLPLDAGNATEAQAPTTTQPATQPDEDRDSP
jgi:hypothetical protein